MDPAEVERLIEEGIEGAEATVRQTRQPGEEADDHFAAVVVSPAFEGERLVEQHEMVYDALGEHMTTDVHAMEIETYTPGEYEERKEREEREDGD